MTRTEMQKEPEIKQSILPWEAKYREPFPARVKAVLDKGCRPIPLRELLRPAASEAWYEKRRRLEIESLKKNLSRVSQRIRDVADDLKRIADNPLWVASVDMTEGRNLALVQTFRDRVDDFGCFSNDLDRAKSDIAELWSVRRSNYLVPLCVYCRLATDEKVTIREIADLLDWAGADCDEHSISMTLTRHRKEPYFSYLQDQIQSYVSDHPSGDVSFGAWSRTNRNRAIENGGQTCTS